jgi:hypothetical protein
LLDAAHFLARSTSHSVAAHDGCTNIPLAAVRAQEDETILENGFSGHDDQQLDRIMSACEPLHPQVRSAFVEAIANELAGCPMVGEGNLHRAIVEVQGRFFNAPLSRQAPGMHSKYRNGTPVAHGL